MGQRRKMFTMRGLSFLAWVTYFDTALLNAINKDSLLGQDGTIPNFTIYFFN